jgi:hypothetical protein
MTLSLHNDVRGRGYPARVQPDERFGRWIVLRLLPRVPGKKTHAAVRCDCGTESAVEVRRLQSGETKSCGCFAHEVRMRKCRRFSGRSNLMDYEDDWREPL